MFKAVISFIKEVCPKIIIIKKFLTHLVKVGLSKKLFGALPARWMIKQQTHSIHDLHYSIRWVSVVAHLLQVRRT